MRPSLVLDLVTSQAQPILDTFYDAVVACGHEPPFKPSIVIATAPDATRYDPVKRAIVLVPYEVLQLPRRHGPLCRYRNARLVRARAIHRGIQPRNSS